jgi:hypothetical protein
MEGRKSQGCAGFAHLARRAVLCAVLCAAAAAPFAPAPVSAYTFNEPTVRQVGPDMPVFDWSAQKCEDNDITDESARAFRDDSGKVQLITTHFVNYRFIGDSLDTLTHPCTKIMSSTNSADHSLYNGREWIASPWTPDGRNVYALVHNEYQGHLFTAGDCIRPGETQAERWLCWYNAVTSAYSTNSGATYTQPPAPGHLVATIPYQYERDGPNGYFFPSNVVRAGDGYLYAMFRAEDKGAQQLGTCLMRTRDASDPTSWRAWSGSGFIVSFQNPYTGAIDPAQHVCAPIDFTSIGTMSESLTYNTYFGKWMLVGASVGSPQHGLPPGFYYALSENLIDWDDYRLLMEAEITWSRDCVNPPYPIRDPSVLDPDSTARNFETVGQTAYLFYTEHHNSGCNGTLDRDLRRIPIEFSNQEPGGPTAELTASTRTAAVGERVRFDASGSSDSDGTVQRYRWDLDGDGTFERTTGAKPIIFSSFPSPGAASIKVRVVDDDGKSTDETELVKVAAGRGPRGRR